METQAIWLNLIIYLIVSLNKLTPIYMHSAIVLNI